MINKFLHSSVVNFKREITSSLSIIRKQGVHEELEGFKVWLTEYYENLEREIDTLAYHVSLKDDSIDPDIYNALASRRNRFQIYSNKFLHGLYRTHQNDRMSLTVLKWLHDQHPQTKGQPFVIMDGDFAILPQVGFPICYYLPIVSQQSFLFLPLFFHELGHYFYQCHREEMDGLVGELQSQLRTHLIVPFRTNSPQHREDAEKAQVIMETWYEWTQEFFCDAVGLHIGGATFLKAFSHYLRTNGQSSYHVPEADLMNSGHPVTWLRIRFLADRARKLGLSIEADEVETEWSTIASALNIREEYFGYYTNQYHSDIVKTIDDMLVEANPISYKDYSSNEILIGQNNFIGLIHEAWQKFDESPIDYSEWEQQTIATLFIHSDEIRSEFIAKTTIN